MYRLGTPNLNPAAPADIRRHSQMSAHVGERMQGYDIRTGDVILLQETGGVVQQCLHGFFSWPRKCKRKKGNLWKHVEAHLAGYAGEAVSARAADFA